jgi:hypothetical protein
MAFDASVGRLEVLGLGFWGSCPVTLHHRHSALNAPPKYRSIFTSSDGEIGENPTDSPPQHSTVFTDFTANLEIPR